MVKTEETKNQVEISLKNEKGPRVRNELRRNKQHLKRYELKNILAHINIVNSLTEKAAGLGTLLVDEKFLYVY